VSRVNGWLPQSWSPDGRWLAGSTQANDGTEHLALYSLESKQFTTLPARGIALDWLHDNRRLFIVTPNRDMALLDYISGSTRTLIKVSSSEDVFVVSVSPDDRQLLLFRTLDRSDIWIANLNPGR
jgi:Tol biopolymer transport system component